MYVTCSIVNLTYFDPILSPMLKTISKRKISLWTYVLLTVLPINLFTSN